MGHRSTRIIHTLALCTIIYAVIIVKLSSGLLNREFGGHPDEAAHVVTGLMFYDYLHSEMSESPVDYAYEYYSHYPKVAIGHWPPMFYIVQSTWLTAFGTSARSFMHLMTALGVLLAFMVYRISSRRMPQPLPLVLALYFVMLPLVQKLTTLVMTECLQAILALSAALCYAKYLELKRPYLWGSCFGLIASLCILTKGTGLALSLLPLTAIIIGDKVRCLKTLHFWIPAITVLAVCAPFYLLTLKMQLNGMASEEFSITFTVGAVPFYLRQLVFCSGAVVFISAIIGLAEAVVIPRVLKRDVTPQDSAIAALLISTIVFHFLVPCGYESRHLMLALPAMIYFAGIGMRYSFRKIVTFPGGRVLAPLVSIAMFALCVRELSLFTNDTSGYRKLVADMAVSADHERDISMVCSDSIGEGMAVSEWALQDQGQRPKSYIFRASKLLSTQKWSGNEYREKFSKPEEMLDYLRSIPIRTVIIDNSVSPHLRERHQEQLAELARVNPQAFKLVGTYDITRRGVIYDHAITVYELIVDENAVFNGIEIDMTHSLNKTINVSETPQL